MECPICCLIRTRLVNCSSCDHYACERCQYRYMQENTGCMVCKSTWTAFHIRKNFSKKRSQELIKIKYKLEFDNDVSINHDQLVSLHIQTESLKSKHDELMAKKRQLEDCMRQVNTELISIQNMLLDPQAFSVVDLQHKPCINLGCRGVLDSTGRCVTCKDVVCASCKMPITSNHTCDPGVLKTINLITSSCKPCPVCKVLVHKRGGCDDMWCTRCKHAYSWRTGQLLTVNIRYHNPHFADDSDVTGLWDVIRDITTGSLRALMKSKGCDPVLIGCVINVLNNVVEFRFEHLRHESRRSSCRKKYDDLQMHVVLAKGQVSPNQLAIIRNTIEKEDFILKCIQNYVQRNSSALYSLRQSLHQTADIDAYIDELHNNNDVFFHHGLEYTQSTWGRFPYILMDNLRIVRK